jgi:hypothetical protein
LGLDFIVDTAGGATMPLAEHARPRWGCAMSESAMVSVIAGARCVGFLIGRGREGVEAYDSNERSLGIFLDPIEAARAVEDAAPSGPEASS